MISDVFGFIFFFFFKQKTAYEIGVRLVGSEMCIRDRVHPMHLHGHHALILSRDGKPATGSPWWVDSLNVADGETYEIAFVADNPGIWMDHCHNLRHAAEGLVAHLMYAGYNT